MGDNALLIDGRTITYYVAPGYNLEFDSAMVLREWVPELLELINSNSVYVELLNSTIIMYLPRVAKDNVKEFGKQIQKAFYERLLLNGCKLITGMGRENYLVEIRKHEGLEVK